MLAVILKILSILGIILLVLLGVLVVVLALVLFLPIVYRVNIQKDSEKIVADARARWLFGIIRARYGYPEPGKVVVKALWATIYDSKKSGEKEKAGNLKAASSKEKGNASTDVPPAEDKAENIQPTTSLSQEQKENQQESGSAEEAGIQPENTVAESEESEDAKLNEEKKSIKEKLFAKYEKIKYTVEQIYDKIKDILDNISFYKKLLQDEQTKLLFSHVCRRVGKVLYHIRPRKLKTNVVFGAESPDTTGYVYAVYGMLSSKLGKDVNITPDFTQQIFEGTIYAAGHITVFTLLVHVIAVLLDKRLQILKRRLEHHKQKSKATLKKTEQ